MKTKITGIIKKIGTLATGGLFMGSTLLGAMAYDLNSYPQPFINDGVFNGNIVVGANAAAEDIIGAVDIGTSLQYANKQKISYSQDVDTSVDSGFKVEKSGDKFNYGDSIASILDGTYLTEDDLPQILTESKFYESQGDNKNSVTYTQKLNFVSDETGKLVYTQDDDTAKEANSYLYISKRKPLYNYTLEFDTPVKYNPDDVLDDLKTSVINIEGKPYTISDVNVNNDGEIDKLSLISGEAVMWLTQNQPIEKSINGVQHNIEVVDVTEGANACQVKVDGTTSIIDVDSTQTINGVQIGITDVRAIHAQLQDTDVCQVALSASELELENNNEVKVDDVSFDGSNVQIESTDGELNSISITYTPKDMDDDLYLEEKEAWTDPIFNSWKIVFGDVSSDYEEYSLEASGDNDGLFKFISNDHRKVELPIYYDEDANTTKLGNGEGIDEKIYGEGTYSNLISDTCTGTFAEDCEGMQIIATTPGKEVHVFEITNIDTDTNTTDIKDLTYGRTFNDIDFVQNTDSSIDLGSFGTGIKLNINASSVRVVNSLPTKIETASGAIISDIDDSIQNTLKIQLDEDGIDSEGTPDKLDLTIKPDSDKEINVDADWETSSSSIKSDEDSDVNILMSAMGTKVYENDDNTDIQIEMPTDEIYANVFITGINGELSSNNNSITTYKLNRMSVDTAKTDNEISDISAQNLVVVGGPCVSRITANVMGLPYPSCGSSSTIEPNTAIIKEFAQQNGHVALIVAGYNQENTRVASKILSNFDQYNLTGNSYKIIGTSLENVVIQKSS